MAVALIHQPHPMPICLGVLLRMAGPTKCSIMTKDNDFGQFQNVAVYTVYIRHGVYSTSYCEKKQTFFLETITSEHLFETFTD